MSMNCAMILLLSKWSIVSKSKNWTKTTRISPKIQSSSSYLSHIALAAEIKNGESSPSPPSATPPEAGRGSESASSGVLIGGYDPIVMTNGLFLLLQEKSIISPNEAFQLKNDVLASKEGVLLGGVNVLKFCEVILNTFISKKLLSIDQANKILEKSQNAGGVLIGGYNIIILEIEILNTLLQNGKITLSEGQKVIDR